MSIVQQISRLQSLIKQHDPEGFKKLPGPASNQDIENIKKRYGSSIPADYIVFLKTHNGMSSDFLLNEIMSVEDVLSSADTNDSLEDGDFDDSEAEAGDGVKSVWWSDKWIPISSNGGGDHDCIDMSPAPGGKKGQIVCFYHDDETREVVAPSFTEWLIKQLDTAERWWEEQKQTKPPPPKKKSWWGW